MLDKIFELKEINGVPVDQLFTTKFSDFDAQTYKKGGAGGGKHFSQPWGTHHCLQSMIPRAFGFWTIMYLLTRMGRWKKARRRISMVVQRGVHKFCITINDAVFRQDYPTEVQSRWFVSWQALGCVFVFLWPKGLWRQNPRKPFEHLTLFAAPFVRPRLWLRAVRKPRILIKPLISGTILSVLFLFFRHLFVLLTPFFRPYTGFWKELVREKHHHRKAWMKRISWMFTRQAQHRQSLQGAYETLSDPFKYMQPAIALPAAAELAQRVAEVPLKDDSPKYGKDLSDAVPDAVLSFRQFLQTAQDAVKDFSLNPHNPPASSHLSTNRIITKEDVDTYFIEDWDEDVQYRPQLSPVSEAISIPKRGGGWTPEPPKVYTFLDKIVNRPESVHGENWPQNIKDYKSGSHYRTHPRRSPQHLYDDRSWYYQQEGTHWDLDRELHVEPKFPRMPDIHYLWTRRFADEYWSPEDDWCFTEEEYEAAIKRRTKIL